MSKSKNPRTLSAEQLADQLSSCAYAAERSVEFGIDPSPVVAFMVELTAATSPQE